MKMAMLVLGLMGLSVMHAQAYASNAIYIGLSRQKALTNDLKVVANDVANADTVGFRSEKLIYQEVKGKGSVGSGRDPKQRLSFTQDIATVTDTRQGTLKYTGSPFDLAIMGKGFFMVGTPAGRRYTRAGNFILTSQGELMTQAGSSVLGSSGEPVIVPEIREQFVVEEDGKIKVDGQESGQIGIVEFDNEQDLSKEGDTLYKTDVTSKPAEAFRIVQGYQEASNVESVIQMNKMILISRYVSNTGEFIADMGDIESQAVRTLGKVSR